MALTPATNRQAAGTSGFYGGAGADGQMNIREHYQ